MTTLGQRLRKSREAKGWSQTIVCRKLGISNSTLSGYERDYREPDAEMIATFANLYEVSTDYLLGTSNSSNKKSELTDKDEKDIAKRVEKIREDLSEDEGYMLMGEPISEEAKEAILDAMEFAIRQATKINKKYIPKKYRDK
ncbi:helix-turn-helix domain-containing protein [Cytobacillus firmus]|uniref:helix-turn-helix domain-containing protein n=1 Tax=Cytobacillus firmus TaxID=1399 RepID=UPI0018CD4FBF|nr:helix-turn-helix transcriptional regulator [Cytobacillus firmus]MBG9653702.1 immunity repressor protein [Cytobacillus firmus]MED1904987.1 helix-turn-helix transcriptional regulator [Cytobacillus firmus]